MIKFIADQDARVIASVEQVGMVYLLGKKIISKLSDKNDIINNNNTLAEYPTDEIARKAIMLSSKLNAASSVTLKQVFYSA